MHNAVYCCVPNKLDKGSDTGDILLHNLLSSNSLEIAIVQAAARVRSAAGDQSNPLTSNEEDAELQRSMTLWTCHGPRMLVSCL